jgi:DNA-binding Xre family transcriptional regulator
MAIHVYSSDYLDSAQKNLGNMLDYAVNTCNMELEYFYNIFVNSNVSTQFAKGNPRYIAGMSGAELAREVFIITKGEEIAIPAEFYLDKSPEYWCGWSLAYYQWKSGRSFHRINQLVSISEIKNMYPTHHEADIIRFVNTMDTLYEERHIISNLEQVRKSVNISIKELSELSEVEESLLHEMKQDFKKINHIPVFKVLNLSKVFGCSIEDLLEI